jgi:hypothetical protein
MLGTEFLKSLVNVRHLVGPVVVVTPSLEDLLGAKNKINAAIVGEPSRVERKLAKKRLLGKNINNNESETMIARNVRLVTQYHLKQN